MAICFDMTSTYHGGGNVDIDHAKAMTATAAIAARIMRLRICHLLIPDELRNDISASETLGQLPTRRRKAAQAGGERAPQITRASEIGPMIGSDNKDDLVSDLQLDSVGLLTLVVGLEDRFRVALKEEDAAAVRTVGDLAALVLRRREEMRAC